MPPSLHLWQSKDSCQQGHNFVPSGQRPRELPGTLLCDPLSPLYPSRVDFEAAAHAICESIHTSSMLPVSAGASLAEGYYEMRSPFEEGYAAMGRAW